MKLVISRAELTPSSHGCSNITIKQLKLTDDYGKYIKFVKLDEIALKKILKKEIDVSRDLEEEKDCREQALFNMGINQ